MTFSRDAKVLVESFIEGREFSVETFTQDNVTNIIADHCLNILKLRLFSLDDRTKQRIREVFSIARRDAKNNVPIKEFITNYYNELKIIFLSKKIF